MKKIAVMLVFVLCFCFCACEQGPKTIDYDHPQFASPKTGDCIAVITTSVGVIKLLLFASEAPTAVGNFRALIERGYYDGTLFHRVVPQLLIQAGDKTLSGTGGESADGNSFPNEYSDFLRNFYGALGMASDSNGANLSQFYIVTAPPINDTVADELGIAGYSENEITAYLQIGGAPHLDFRYTVFGQVYEGFETLDLIAAALTDSLHRPEKDITIISIELFDITAETAE